MVALLWDQGDVTAAIELESLWNELGLRVPFSLFCAYPSQSVSGDGHTDAYHEVCHLHSAVVGPTPSQRHEGARHFASALHAPREARSFVVETLTQWGCDALLDDAATVVTELAANAVVHAGSDFTVSLSSPIDGAVRIAVRDSSTVLPILDERASAATSGRGIVLVAAISREWGADPTADGKVVWAELRR
jgi:anti-sigma regulatory factor (Ser/Thr protein kinase)